MGCTRFDLLWNQASRRKPDFALITEKSINSKYYTFLPGFYKRSGRPRLSILQMAEYIIPSADSNKSPEYGPAYRSIIPSANYYNLCRFKLSKIEINQKGFYSAGSCGGRCLYAGLYHFAFQVCTVCRNTSVDLPRNVSPRCPLTWRFDLFRSLCCSIKNPYLGTNLKWSAADWMRHPDSTIIPDALPYLFHRFNPDQSKNQTN